MKKRWNIYKNMMSGVSQLLPFIVAGGIFISLSFLFESNNSSSQIATWFDDTGNLILSFGLPILAAFIAYAIADRPALVPGFLAGALAATGNSGFLGALIGGFFAGYIVLLLIKLFSKIPRALHGITPILIFPLFGALFTALFMIGVNIAIEPITAALHAFLSDLNGLGVILLALIAAALMAFDLGGPVNKIIYMIGIASILGGVQSILMAAIMVGGMIPPLGVALATLLFKNKFDEKLIEQGKKNWIFGSIFITEGAIPFTESNPKIVIPVLIFGSAIAGALVGYFQTSLAIPHGGILVIVFMQNWWGFVIALVSGILASSILLGILLPKTQES